MEKEVERYRKPTRILHWIHIGSFCVLFLTGLVLFIPGLGFLAQGSITRVLHRVAAAVFVIAPIVYFFLNREATIKGIKEAFRWGSEDIGWAVAAPRYYFLADEASMPPQGHMNTGQKLWWLMALVTGALFILTGIIMWFFKTLVPPTVLQIMVSAHDITFIAVVPMFFVHIYLSAFHPLMRPQKTGAWASMARGKVSAEYARTHHAKWYNEITGGKK